MVDVIKRSFFVICVVFTILDIGYRLWHGLPIM